jgi:hypothetical protein
VIATGRSDTRRGVTEEWLARYHVRYEYLAMAPWDEIVTAHHAERAAEWKARTFAGRPDLRWFVESDADQARMIAGLARKTCICYTTGDVYGAEYSADLSGRRK